MTLWDDRLADQRRLDAAVDLLLGRNPLGAGHGAGCASGCGCLPGQAAPCGTNVNVHVTYNGALGTTDEAATLERHGPIEPDLLQALLLNSPVLRAVFVNEHGVPIGMSRQRLRPERGDPESVRDALLRLGNLKPDKLTCDAEHDRAWPDGPTCSCDLGPCCRHHHRIKQLGFTKTRHEDGSVTWGQRSC